MKMNIYFKGLVVSLLLIAGMFTSCEDQPDKFELTGGLPQVSYNVCLIWHSRTLSSWRQA